MPAFVSEAPTGDNRNAGKQLTEEDFEVVWRRNKLDIGALLVLGYDIDRRCRNRSLFLQSWTGRTS